MRTKSQNGLAPRVNVVTLGCSKNLVDSEVLLAQLRAGKKDAVHEATPQRADTVVINTCGFIDQAKEQSIQTILDFAEKKKRGEIKELYVTGCLSQRYMPDLKRDIPEVDGFFGAHQDLPNLVKELGVDFRKELVGERTPATDGHYAYLKVSEGCDRGCSFCAIPLMRGAHESREIEFLVKEAEHLVGRGVKEIILIAQDLTSYGADIYKRRALNELLEKLAEVKGLEWIRLHYAYPAGFPEDILPTMRNQPTICNYLDMPLQHIADPLLKKMRRAITRKRIEGLLDRIRDQVPGVAIRSTLLVGHPGETEEHHQELLEFLTAARIERLGVFLYSHEENTHSFTFEDDVPADVKQRRFDEVMKLQQGISLELNQAKVGETLRTVIDRKEGERFIGRTEHDSPEVDNEVLIEGQDLQVGTFYEVEITGAMEYDLAGNVS